MKYLIPILFVFSSFAQEVKENHLLLWEISGNGLKENSYLFGSIHSNDKRVFNFSDSTYVALNSVKSIALETDIFSIFGDKDVRLTRVSMQYDKNGKPYTPSGKSGRTAYGDEDGMPQFLDAYFEQYCYNAGKSFEMLEPLDYQLDLIESLEMPERTSFQLESFLSNDDQMVRMYEEGDIYRLNDVIKTNLKLIPDWYDKLIVDRNHSMTDVLDSLIRIKSMFCAVGAGHLAGSQGMINLLRMKGYNVRSVAATFSDKEIKEKEKVREYRSYEYHNDTIRFHGTFSGKPKVITSDENTLITLVYQELGQGNAYIVEVYARDPDMSDDELAKIYIPSPENSPVTKHHFENSDVYYDGIADAYPEGVYWARLMIKDDYFLLLKAYGGNKFMNSPRAENFFNHVIFEE